MGQGANTGFLPVPNMSVPAFHSGTRKIATVLTHNRWTHRDRFGPKRQSPGIGKALV